MICRLVMNWFGLYLIWVNLLRNLQHHLFFSLGPLSPTAAAATPPLAIASMVWSSSAVYTPHAVFRSDHHNMCCDDDYYTFDQKKKWMSYERNSTHVDIYYTPEDSDLPQLPLAIRTLYGFCCWIDSQCCCWWWWRRMKMFPHFFFYF